MVPGPGVESDILENCFWVNKNILFETDTFTDDVNWNAQESGIFHKLSTHVRW